MCCIGSVVKKGKGIRNLSFFLFAFKCKQRFKKLPPLWG